MDYIISALGSVFSPMGLLMNLYGNYRITADFESGRGYHTARCDFRLPG